LGDYEVYAEAGAESLNSFSDGLEGNEVSGENYVLDIE